MKNLNLLFPFLKLCVTNTSDVLKNLYNFTEEMRCKNLVVEKFGLNQGLLTIDLLELLPDFNETIDHYSFLEGTSYITDLALLKGLARKFENTQYMEFGTWRGESIVNVAAVAEKSVSLSFSEGEMRQFGITESAIKVCRIFSKNNSKITHIEHNTQTYDFKDLEGKFDLIFVDADHKYPGVKKDTQNAFKLLKDERSIIVWHDSGRGTEDTNWQVTAGLMDGAPSDAHRKKIFHVSNTICAIYINGDFKAHYPEKYFPNKIFSINISAKKFQ